MTLWVQADDDELHAMGPKVPSNASADFGEPFAQIFHRYNGDFYKIDPLLFSPAVVTFVNLEQRPHASLRYAAAGRAAAMAARLSRSKVSLCTSPFSPRPTVGTPAICSGLLGIAMN